LDTVIFDKTGTVTEGEFRLVDFALAGDDAATSTDRFHGEDLPILVSLERYSEHPLARALVAYASARGIQPGEAVEIEVVEGQGISGRVGDRRVFIGSPGFAPVRDAGIPPRLIGGRGDRTLAYYGWDGRLRGLLAFGDRVKPSAGPVFAALKKSGVQVWIVSGDVPEATAAVAAAVGADEVRAGCLPGGKEQVIRELQARGKVVAMVGDGVNDAPALSQADLGIAMGSGTDIAVRAAPVTLIGSDLLRVPEAFALARATVRIVRQNLIWAVLYNAVGITLAVAGILNPIVAAAAMVVSSLSVILNSLRVHSARSARW
jgi:cation transport ATPase